jgi:hypothetical protein
MSEPEATQAEQAVQEEVEVFNVDEMRAPAIRMHGLTKADDVYTLYYDETQNVRRLHVTPEGLNVREPQCFVLGGIAHAGEPRDLGFDKVRSALRLQPSAKEMKFAQVAKGDFLSLLRSQRLSTLLNWLIAEGLFIHYQATDPLYWSTVDMVDSILAEFGEPRLYQLAPPLKSDLHTVLRADLDDLVDLFQRYTYPDVGRERRGDFLQELLNRLDARRQFLPDFNFQMLKGMLEIGMKLGALPFLEEEEPHVLINDFASFYLNRVCLLKNASHILDTETRIMERLNATPLESGGAPFRNFRFVESSEGEIGVQISDVVVGLFGKFFAWAVATERADVARARATLTPIQERNRSAMAELLDRSIEENEMFAQNAFSLEDQHKAGIFLDAGGRPM